MRGDVAIIPHASRCDPSMRIPRRYPEAALVSDVRRRMSRGGTRPRQLELLYRQLELLFPAPASAGA
jgi:hypothetical protein